MPGKLGPDTISQLINKKLLTHFYQPLKFTLQLLKFGGFTMFIQIMISGSHQATSVVQIFWKHIHLHLLG